MSERNKYDLELLPVLEYAPAERPPGVRRAQFRVRKIIEAVIDAMGPRFLAFASAMTFFFGGIAIGGAIGIVMIITSGFFMRLLLQLWYRHSRW